MPSGKTKNCVFNYVTNIANSLFDVLDSEYANKTSNTIEKVKGSEQYLQNYLKHRTSVLNSTINIIKQNEIATARKLTQLNSTNSESHLSKLIPHLPPQKQIPEHRGNLLSLFKPISIQPGITVYHLISKLIIPVKISTEFLAVNLRQDKYFLTRTTNLEK